MYLLFCLFVNTLLYMTCSVNSYSNPSPRIIGGSIADIKQFPYIAYLHIKYGSNGTSCTAVIIGDEWILTAAHCFDVPHIHLAEVRVGSSSKNNSNDGKRIALGPATTHPNYNNANKDYDFALAKLKQKLEWSDKIDYIDLPNDEDKVNVGDPCITVGWGLVENNAPTDLLNQVTLPIFNRAECNSLYEKGVTINMYCAGSSNDGKGLCNGDVGSPLVCKSKLFGIGAFTKKKCGEAPSVFGRIKSISQWITKVSGIFPTRKSVSQTYLIE